MLKGYYNTKSDVWSCGAVCYACVSGRPAPHTKNIQNDPIIQKSSKKLKHLLLKVLAYDSTERTSADSALMSNLLKHKQINPELQSNIFVNFKNFRVGSHCLITP